MRYVTALTLELKHDYYQDGRCRDVQVEPAAESECLLRGYRCLWKSRPDGGDILVPVTAGGAPQIPFPATPVPLRFVLKYGNPEFQLFTVTNSPPLTEQRPPELVLNLPPGGGAVELPGEIAFDWSPLPGLQKREAAGLTIQYEARSARWIYCVLSGRSFTDRLGIKSIKAGASDPTPWKKPEGNYQNLCNMLQERFSTGSITATAFISPEAIPCRVTALSGIKLELAGAADGDSTVLFENLPNPPWRNTLQSNSGGESVEATEVFFQVVNCSTIT